MKEADKYNLIVVLGPTATGKTRFAAHLADRIFGEIISADSRQVYRNMDLGTGKDYHDYLVGSKRITYHLIDIQEPGYKYNVFEYQKDFSRVFQEIRTRNHIPILCGGTGMYIESVTKAYQLISVPINQPLRDSLQNKSLKELEDILSKYKRLHNKSDSDTVKRAIRAIEIEEYSLHNPELQVEMPVINPLYIGILVDREIRRARISERLKNRLQMGMVEEVERLLDSGISPEDLMYYGLEYKYITLYLTEKISYEEMFQSLNVAIHQFAKRQMTWFRKMEREGCKIHWLDATDGLDFMLMKALKILAK